MMLTIMKSLLGDLVGGIQEHFKDKRQAKAQERAHDYKLREAKTEARIKYLSTAQAADIEWDIQAQQNAESSWKDEWFVIVLSIPLIGVFIPGLEPFITAGFLALTKTPEWYQIAVGLAIASSFGYRKFIDVMRNKNAKPN